jgi:hypothetical protein
MWLQVLSSAGVAKVRQISRRYFWIEPCVIFFWEGSPLGAFKTPAEISIPKAEQVEIACPVGTNQIKCKTLRHHPSPNNSTYHLPLALAGSQCVDAAGDASGSGLILGCHNATKLREKDQTIKDTTREEVLVQILLLPYTEVFLLQISIKQLES